MIAHELGRVARTEFLLNWISDLELRRVTLRAMNKSEQFNPYITQHIKSMKRSDRGRPFIDRPLKSSLRIIG
jgi:Tn3 transposase DDE domain